MIDRDVGEAAGRREALKRIGFVALMAGFPFPVVARAGEDARTVVFPSAPMVLRRELERGLMDGNAIVVVREWQCSFAPDAGGCTVSGRQTMVDVAAPRSLAALAEIERRRAVDGLFPLVLDRSGQITAGPASSDGRAIQHAIETARAVFEGLPAAVVAAADPDAFLRQVNATAAEMVSRVPRDLFFPTPGTTTDARDIALDDGETGRIEVVVEAQAQPGSGLLASSQRTVRTSVGESVRVSREAWSMRAA